MLAHPVSCCCPKTNGPGCSSRRATTTSAGGSTGASVGTSRPRSPATARWSGPERNARPQPPSISPQPCGSGQRRTTSTRLAHFLAAAVAAADPVVRATAWTNLGHLHNDRYEMSEEPQWLVAAEQAYREALSLTAPDAPTEPPPSEPPGVRPAPAVAAYRRVACAGRGDRRA